MSHILKYLCNHHLAFITISGPRLCVRPQATFWTWEVFILKAIKRGVSWSHLEMSSDSLMSGCWDILQCCFIGSESPLWGLVLKRRLWLYIYLVIIQYYNNSDPLKILILIMCQPYSWMSFYKNWSSCGRSFYCHPHWPMRRMKLGKLEKLPCSELGWKKPQRQAPHHWVWTSALGANRKPGWRTVIDNDGDSDRFYTVLWEKCLPHRVLWLNEKMLTKCLTNTKSP